MVGSSVTGTVLSTASAYSASLVKKLFSFSVSRQSSLKLPEKTPYFAKSFILSLWIIEAFSSEKELSLASWRSTAQGPLLFQMKVMLKLWNQSSGMFGKLTFVQPLLLDLRNRKVLKDERSSAGTSNDASVRFCPSLRTHQIWKHTSLLTYLLLALNTIVPAGGWALTGVPFPWGCPQGSLVLP